MVRPQDDSGEARNKAAPAQASPRSSVDIGMRGDSLFANRADKPLAGPGKTP
jgi:hypothetical protein